MAGPEQFEVRSEYKLVYNKPLEALKNRAYEAGGKAPGENELVERFNVSRPTVVCALSQLEGGRAD